MSECGSPVRGELPCACLDCEPVRPLEDVVGQPRDEYRLDDVKAGAGAGAGAEAGRRPAVGVDQHADGRPRPAGDVRSLVNARPDRVVVIARQHHGGDPRPQDPPRPQRYIPVVGRLRIAAVGGGARRVAGLGQALADVRTPS